MRLTLREWADNLIQVIEDAETGESEGTIRGQIRALNNQTSELPHRLELDVERFMTDHWIEDEGSWEANDSWA